MINKATKTERKELAREIFKCEKALMEWLAGPEAHKKPKSAEYNAFTAMFMAADSAQITQRKRRT